MKPRKLNERHKWARKTEVTNVEPQREDAKEILEQFIKAGEGHYFRLKNGEHYQGYIETEREEVITDDAFLFWSSGPMAPDFPVPVRIADIDLTTLRFHNDEDPDWTPFEVKAEVKAQADIVPQP
ncbi:MAG: hypothetical protein V4671_07375 [Armatimonadota bacterium]